MYVALLFNEAFLRDLYKEELPSYLSLRGAKRRGNLGWDCFSLDILGIAMTRTQ